jgi:hypothetical protein
MLQALKVMSSNPDHVIGFLNLPNSSSRITALGSTQPLTDLSARILPESKVRPAAYGLRPYSHLLTNCLENVGALSHNPMGH